MTRHKALLLLVLVLSACGGPATPTPDAVATQIAVEEAAHATMTASVPTATATPAPTETPTATSTPTPTATATPTETPTSTATPEPTPTLIPVVVPQGWSTYTHFAGLFSVAYPPKWEVNKEGTALVVFDVPGFAWSVLGVSTSQCDIGQGEDPAEAQKCMALSAAGQADSSERFLLVGTDTWNDGVYHGYVVEWTEYDTIYEVTTYNVEVFIPVPDTAWMIVATYGRTATKTITSQERSQLASVVSTFRVLDLE